MPGLDRHGARARSGFLRTARPDEVTAHLRALCADDTAALLSALDAAEQDGARQAETASRCGRIIAEALALIDRADGDPHAASHLRDDMRLLLQSGRGPETDHAVDVWPRRAETALAVIADVDVDLLPGQSGDLLRQVRAALTGAGDWQAVPA